MCDLLEAGWQVPQQTKRIKCHTLENFLQVHIPKCSVTHWNSSHMATNEDTPFTSHKGFYFPYICMVKHMLLYPLSQVVDRTKPRALRIVGKLSSAKLHLYLDPNSHNHLLNFISNSVLPLPLLPLLSCLWHQCTPIPFTHPHSFARLLKTFYNFSPPCYFPKCRCNQIM